MNGKPNFIAGGTINPSCFVVMSTAADETVVAASATTAFINGISQEWSKLAPIPDASTAAAVSGDPVKVYTIGDVCLLTCGTTITRGDLLTSDSSGNAVTATSGNYYGAQALESGTTSALIRVFCLSGKI